MRQHPQPRNEEIVEDGIFQRDNLVYITMFVNGSHQVEINGMKYMPGQFIREEFSSNMIFDGSYNIRFLTDYATPVQGVESNNANAWNILDNPNLKKGQFIYVRFATAT
jgi:hypothetical protein